MDIANRLPLLEILLSEFKDYQLFVTTYDKSWYEYVRGFLEGDKTWKTLEFYAEETSAGYELPRIYGDREYLEKAQWHYDNFDYKAAAVYARSAFEKILRNYCAKNKKKITFKPKMKDYSSQDFWSEVQGEIDPAMKNKIEQYRSLVLNPFSHYDPEKHEIKTEVSGAIEAVKELKIDLDSKRKSKRP